MNVEQFRRGIEEFNNRSFFECHDTLEDLWHGTRGKDRLFLQGLIQVSVGFYHLFNRNYKGAISQMNRGLVKLDSYRPTHGGIELDQFAKDVGCWLGIAEQGARNEEIDLNEMNIPKIQYI